MFNYIGVIIGKIAIIKNYIGHNPAFKEENYIFSFLAFLSLFYE